MYAIEAHTFIPPTLDTVAASDTVYLAHIDAIELHNKGGAPADKVIYSIIEVLRGAPRSKMDLTEYPGSDFKVGTNWILYRYSAGSKDCVGRSMEGDCEWLPIFVTGQDGQANGQWVGPIDNLKAYLQQHPYKK
jgi:hypothetical protein